MMAVPLVSAKVRAAKGAGLRVSLNGGEFSLTLEQAEELIQDLRLGANLATPDVATYWIDVASRTWR